MKSTELQCGDQSPEFTPQEQTKNMSFSDSGCPESDFRPVQSNATQEPGDSPPLPGQQESSRLLGAGSEGPWQSHPAAGTLPAPPPQMLRARAQGPGLSPCCGGVCVSAHAAQGASGSAAPARGLSWGGRWGGTGHLGSSPLLRTSTTGCGDEQEGQQTFDVALDLAPPTPSS